MTANLISEATMPQPGSRQRDFERRRFKWSAIYQEATMPDPIETLRATLEQTLGIRVHYWDAEAVMARMGVVPAE